MFDAEKLLTFALCVYFLWPVIELVKLLSQAARIKLLDRKIARLDREHNTALDVAMKGSMNEVRDEENMAELSRISHERMLAREELRKLEAKLTKECK